MLTPEQILQLAQQEGLSSGPDRELRTDGVHERVHEPAHAGHEGHRLDQRAAVLVRLDHRAFRRLRAAARLRPLPAIPGWLSSLQDSHLLHHITNPAECC